MAMDLLQAGVDRSVIALWLGHESVETTGSVEEAIRAAHKAASDDDLILITGSLYVVGEARAVLVPDARRLHALNGLTG